MFGVSGVEFLVILLVALIVLGPEKLPDAVRKTGRVIGELRRMSNGFQSELRSALDEPYKEVKGTFDSARQSLKDTAGSVTSGFDTRSGSHSVSSPAPVKPVSAALPIDPPATDGAVATGAAVAPGAPPLAPAPAPAPPPPAEGDRAESTEG